MKTITYDETTWQLVPKKPTEEMKKASLMACDGKAYPADMRIGPMAMNADVYQAMLAAAPNPGAQRDLRLIPEPRGFMTRRSR